MHRRLLPAVAALLVVAPVVCSLERASAKDPEPPAKGIAALSWLQGAWRTADGESVWEAVYSSPEGGEVVSASKEIAGGKVATFDYERFFEKDGKVIFSPHPGGKKSKHDFPAESLDAAAKKAVFVNTANDFPSKFTYHRVADDRLTVTLEGAPGGNPMKIAIEFRRR